MNTLFTIVAILLTLAGASIIIFTLRLGISPMPTSRNVKRVLLEMLPNEVQGTVYELGTGWGCLIPLLERYASQGVVGYEKSPVPSFICRARVWYMGSEGVSVLQQNFLNADLSDAGLVVCYLFPECMEVLSEKFKRELKSGAWILTHTFALPGWKPVELRRANDLYRTPVYLYRVES